MIQRRYSVLLASLALLGTTAVAVDYPHRGPTPTKSKPAKKPADTAKKPEEKKDSLKPYDQVITKEAKTSSGLFIVHRVDDKTYFEIATNNFGKELLWVTQIARIQAGYGYGGTAVGNRVVRWQLREKEVQLRDVKYNIRADVADGIHNAVEATSLEPIIKTFPLAAWATNKSAAVIDVTDLFLADLPEFSAKKRLNATGADRARSYLESIKAFPENIETKALITYTISGDNPPGGFQRSTSPRDPTLGAIAVLLHHSMVKLPEEPMRPRVEDARVGFFDVGFEDYGTSEHRVKEVHYITRWRLEKTDPEAAVSEPKKQIVFYVGRGVPDKWRPWIKKGIEAWQPAFEAAGFKNAIIAKDAPSEKEDPDWDAEDARYSTIMWLPSTIENAMGPHVHDPRTGEILEADILMFHNVLKLLRDWYFVQASPMDPRAQKLPLPDDLLGELLCYVVSHEVGHSLGFPHNMKASSAYTIEQLRDPEFTRKHGTEASIMDYGRFNYVAQPGDGAHLIPVIGPYDFFATEWGYKEFQGAINSAQEKPLLDAIVARQLTDPKLRFGDPDPFEDPSQQTEDLGSDPVQATTLGLKNIDRIAGFLLSATCKENEDYELLQNMYDHLIGQRTRELGHVANVVGGMVRNNAWFGQANRVFEPVHRDRQRTAIAFLNQQAFQTPTNLVDPNILLRLESSGAADRILNSQRGILFSLLNDQRIKRMAEQATRDTVNAYSPYEMLKEVSAGIWMELTTEPIQIDLYRRNLQRTFVELLGGQVNRTDSSSDFPALARSELKRELAAIRAALPKAKEPVALLHLQDLETRIDRILDPRVRTP